MRALPLLSLLILISLWTSRVNAGSQSLEEEDSPISGGGGSQSLEENDDPPIFKCPQDNGKHYTTKNKRTYELWCDHGAPNAPQLPPPITADTAALCAEKCSEYPEAVTCDWGDTTNPKTCSMKKAPYLKPTDMKGVHSWIDVKNLDPPDDGIVLGVCDTDNGKSYKTDSGLYFYIQCRRHVGQNLLGAKTVVSSFAACMDKCGSADGCMSVGYTRIDNSDNPTGDPRGNCGLYDQVGESTNACSDMTHDYAYLVHPPTKPDTDVPSKAMSCTTECPYADGQQFTSDFGETFHIDCGKRHGTDAFYAGPQSSLEDCMNACAKAVACHSVDFMKRTGTCYFSSHQNEPKIDAPGFDSAHSMGCSGACMKKECATPKSEL